MCCISPRNSLAFLIVKRLFRQGCSNYISGYTETYFTFRSGKTNVNKSRHQSSRNLDIITFQKSVVPAYRTCKPPLHPPPPPHTKKPHHRYKIDIKISSEMKDVRKRHYVRICYSLKLVFSNQLINVNMIVFMYL